MEQDEKNKLYEILRRTGFLEMEECDYIIQIVEQNFNIKLKDK